MFKLFTASWILLLLGVSVPAQELSLAQLRAERGFELRHMDGRAERCHLSLIKVEQSGKRPDIVELAVKMKGKNKAIASYKVADPDANLGNRGGISILLYNRDMRTVAAAADGSILTFGDRDVFAEDLGLNGKTSASFDFTLKGLKKLTSATIWVSSIRDSDANLSLAPMSAGIAGRNGGGVAPEITGATSQMIQDGDAFGLNLDGSDSDSDTVGLSVAFLDDSDRMVFAFGIVGDDGLLSFSPFSLELVNNPVKGKDRFSVSFSIAGLKSEVDTAQFKFAAIALFDANGNRSGVKVIPIGR